ncbi:hypothetical protein AHF37_09660 [Paragonimus kellicotti]|nr:hypothetical protein AHF37_09660 [Paragonimus kellicotti]
MHWEAVVTNVVNIHKSVQAASTEFKRQLRRINYVTATNYILFITGFLKILESKTNPLLSRRMPTNRVPLWWITKPEARLFQHSVEYLDVVGEAEAALAEALPAVEAARNALDELEKNDVTEIRAFATPPKPVQMVGEALCHILQSGEISWKAARGLMADANFISTLQQMDVEAIPLKNIQNLKGLYWVLGIC